ncbi:hypothetical protein, partial [Chimaeribacter arupi]|uniref:hypothetical protein n=1 Tax=Chimaeribacter arupi TaxID=2060066 RepID=UPI000C799574
VKEPSYKGIQIPLQQQERSDIWQGKVAMTGGGACGWTLSKFNLGIEYIDATHLGKELVPGTAVGATIAFDDDASRNGKFYDISSDLLKYSPKYYPVIIRWSKQKNGKAADKLYLFGKEDAFWNVRLYLKNEVTPSVSYHPTIEEGKVVEMLFPYEKKEGAMYAFVYPNGEKVLTTSIKPDFEKVEKLNIK